MAGRPNPPPALPAIGCPSRRQGGGICGVLSESGCRTPRNDVKRNFLTCLEELAKWHGVFCGRIERHVISYI